MCFPTGMCAPSESGLKKTHEEGALPLLGNQQEKGINGPQERPQTIGGGLTGGGWMCTWMKFRVLQKGEPKSDNIQVLTKDMHAEWNSPQCSPSSDHFCTEEER